MEIKMVNGNIFDEKYSNYNKVQCISLDCRMGMGIAHSFTSRYPKMKNECKDIIIKNNLQVPIVIKHENVFNLITKNNYWDLPTYGNIESCINQLAYMCKQYSVKFLAMPKIGCQLDKLSWNIVKKLIEKYFNDIDIKIIVFTGKKRTI